LAGILVMVGRKIPTLAKLEPEEQPALNSGGVIASIAVKAKAIKYSSYRPLILMWLEKNLRKIRVFILKIDNLFINWINGAREKSQVWTIRSGAWMEHHRQKRKEQTKLLEKLDKTEVSEHLKKIHEEVAKDEDRAFKEKVEVLSGNGNGKAEKKIADIMEKTPFLQVAPEEKFIEEPASESDLFEERRCIDMIAENPKSVEAYEQLGEIYIRQRNFSDARACFRQILKINPEADDVRNKLDEIRGLRDQAVRES